MRNRPIITEKLNYRKNKKLLDAYCKLVSAVNGAPTSSDIDLLKLEINGVIKILEELL